MLASYHNITQCHRPEELNLKPNSSLQCSQEPSTGPSQIIQSTPSLRSIFLSSSHLSPIHPSDLFLSSFPTKILNILLIYPCMLHALPVSSSLEVNIYEHQIWRKFTEMFQTKNLEAIYIVLIYALWESKTTDTWNSFQRRVDDFQCFTHEYFYVNAQKFTCDCLQVLIFYLKAIQFLVWNGKKLNHTSQKICPTLNMAISKYTLKYLHCFIYYLPIKVLEMWNVSQTFNNLYAIQFLLAFSITRHLDDNYTMLLIQHFCFLQHGKDFLHAEKIRVFTVSLFWCNIQDKFYTTLFFDSTKHVSNRII